MLANPVHAQPGLLVLALDRNNAHVGRCTASQIDWASAACRALGGGWTRRSDHWYDAGVSTSTYQERYLLHCNLLQVYRMRRAMAPFVHDLLTEFCWLADTTRAYSVVTAAPFHERVSLFPWLWFHLACCARRRRGYPWGYWSDLGGGKARHEEACGAYGDSPQLHQKKVSIDIDRYQTDEAELKALLDAGRRAVTVRGERGAFSCRSSAQFRQPWDADSCQ